MSDIESVTFAAKGTLQAFDTPMCDAWVIERIPTFEAFIAVYDEKSALALHERLFASFDDYDQACYTSGHARGLHGLDLDTQVDALPNLDFARTYARFMEKKGELAIHQLAGRLCWSVQGDETPSFVDLNTNPDQCLDDYIVMQVVPVTIPEDALSAFPNGYFTDSLSPFENYALAAYMRTAYGYRLIAIGARYICFLRDNPICAKEAALVSADIMSLYTPSKHAISIAQLVETLVGKRHMILNYGNY